MKNLSYSNNTHVVRYHFKNRQEAEEVINLVNDFLEKKNNIIM